MRGSRRLPQVDALRGVAAVVVVVYHWVLALPAFWSPSGHDVWAILARTPARILVAGPEAVVLFFLLSGFVLALPLVERRQSSYGRYLVRRACRLYPLAWVIAGATMAYVAIVGAGPIGAWPMNDSPLWVDAPTGSSVLAHLLLVVPDRSIVAFDPPLWSLVHELRVSLIFPAIVAAALWARPGRATLTAAALTTIVSLTRPTDLTSFAQTVMFLLPFVAGIELARHGQALVALVARAPLAAALLALVAMPVVSYVPPAVNWPMQGLGLHILIPTASAAVLLAVASGPRAVLHAERRGFVFLGRISYSLYLVHGPILALLLKITGRPPTLGLAVAGIVASFALAAVTYRYVERPGIALGKRLAQRVGQPRAIPAPEAA